MKEIVNLLFEARMLKDIDRTGYAFLGEGRESIADHSFTMGFICFVMARLNPDADNKKLVEMALVHDIPEARTGDQNYVHKKYARVDENLAVSHLVKGLPFGDDIQCLIEEFNGGRTLEARLANDADQLSFVLELKKLKDTGSLSAGKWLPLVIDRLKTDTGRQLAQMILKTPWDQWWTHDYSE